MKRKVFFAPQIDAIIEGFKPEDNLITIATYLKLKDVYNVFSLIRSGNDDEMRYTWIEVERGPIDAFGDYKEFKESGLVKSPEEFEQQWKDYYPTGTKWYKFQTSQFRDEMLFYLNGKLFCTIQEKAPTTDFNSSVSDCFEQFVNWIQERILVEMSKLRQNPRGYNTYIQQNLSYAKRLGRIKRKDFWNIIGDAALMTDKNLGKETIRKLKVFAGAAKKKSTPLLKEMTANMFLKICEICYDANDYFKNPDESLTPREKYLKLADGRDAGLRNIDGDSPEAFYEWYHSAERIGAHPWEICRGGNSTHISLFISEAQNGWDVRLAGSSISRVEETVRMAVALFENKIPFQLSEAEEIVRMVTGNDFIGIVPDNIFPRYCHSLFPVEDNIIDFMNLGFDKEIILKIIEKTYWYPLEEIIPS
jgi:hypothetical protein